MPADNPKIPNIPDMTLQGYHFSKAEYGIIVIHEEEVSYRMDEAALLEAIAGLRENKKAYTDEKQYNAALHMFRSALRFLKEEQS